MDSVMNLYELGFNFYLEKIFGDFCMKLQTIF